MNKSNGANKSVDLIMLVRYNLFICDAFDNVQLRRRNSKQLKNREISI